MSRGRNKLTRDRICLVCIGVAVALSSILDPCNYGYRPTWSNYNVNLVVPTRNVDIFLLLSLFPINLQLLDFEDIGGVTSLVVMLWELSVDFRHLSETLVFIPI